MKTSEIKTKWEQFRQQKGYLQRLDPMHPMDFFIGINDRGYDELVLITINEPSLLKSSKALEIEKGKRKDGKWATQITSVDKTNEDIFARLCADLMECSQNAQTEQDGINRITKRFLAWQRLFSTIHTDLPKIVLKGMIGEIYFAIDALSKHYSWDEILVAWEGPNGADRDYQFTDNWYEVKAIATGKDTMTISSLNQLDTINLGYIVKYEVDEVNALNPAAISVSETVKTIRAILASYPTASLLFEQKLVSLGYLDKKSYDEIYFSHKGPSYYLVDNKFPRLTPNSAPAEIVAVRYDLSLAGVEPWRRDETSIWN